MAEEEEPEVEIVKEATERIPYVLVILLVEAEVVEAEDMVEGMVKAEMQMAQEEVEGILILVEEVAKTLVAKLMILAVEVVVEQVEEVLLDRQIGEAQIVVQEEVVLTMLFITIQI